MTRRLPLSAAVLIASVTLGLSAPAFAQDPDTSLRSASQRIDAASRDVNAIERTVKNARKAEKKPEQFIADAVLLMGVKDYDRAADVLNQVIEKYPRHPNVYAEGLNLLGETYFRSKQYLSAKRIFTQILD